VKKLAVFCSGNGSNFQAIVDAVRSRKLRADIALMVSDNPKAFAIQRAANNDIPVFVISPKLFTSREAFEKLIVSVLRSQKIDCVVLAGFMRILTPYFIKAYRGRILNIHPSLLPAFKGAHAIQDAFGAGVQETGVTVHGVTVKLDSGPILAQTKVRVLKSDTLKTLEEKIHRVEHKLYPSAIQKFINK
jgi:phosphoribosylglycinamide formyltransferase-1